MYSFRVRRPSRHGLKPVPNARWGSYMLQLAAYSELPSMAQINARPNTLYMLEATPQWYCGDSKGDEQKTTTETAYVAVFPKFLRK